MRLLIFFLCLIIPLQTAFAAVDIALRGREPVRIEDVYQQNGIPYIAIEDALDAVGLSGHWNSTEHIFRIKTRRGWAEISPGSTFLKIADEYYPLKEPPRFIDGRLRVTDNFILNQLAQLSGGSIYFRNLDPEAEIKPEQQGGGLEQFFAFLLNKKARQSGPLVRAVAIDPGHGGLDAGVIAESGYKEKELNLEVAEKLAKKLKMRLGVPIYLSRDGDYELSAEQRLQAASREDVDLWLLIHAQATFSPDISGISLFVRPDETVSSLQLDEKDQQAVNGSLALARELAAALREDGMPVQGIYPSSRLSLGRGNLPTVQIELGYLSHPQERELLQSAAYQNQLVQALYTGVRRFAQQNKEKTLGQTKN
ncbi:MAG: N-acetylmuramoyl-L-alanine amidase [Desulfuromonadales bacterium]|nr:N-acetylmuramoyl-L-alanine amidase [Desulfuromonadales bacterium]